MPMFHVLIDLIDRDGAVVYAGAMMLRYVMPEGAGAAAEDIATEAQEYASRVCRYTRFRSYNDPLHWRPRLVSEETWKTHRITDVRDIPF